VTPVHENGARPVGPLARQVSGRDRNVGSAVRFENSQAAVTDGPHETNRSVTRSSTQLFEALAREHVPALDLFLRAWLGDSAEVDDVVQESLLVAWRRLDDYDPRRSFGPWLRGIARNVVASRHRSRARRGERLLDDAALDALEARVVQLELLGRETSHERLDALVACIDALPARMRAAVDLRYRDGHAPSVLAAHLGVRAAHARKILERARARLAECLDGRARALGERP